MGKEGLIKFYNDDLKKYDLKENRGFKIIFNELIDCGYNLIIGIDEMQDLIDRLFTWYEIKYPEREFDFYDGVDIQDFAIKKELSNLMDINQLFFRLTDNQIKLLEGNYRSSVMKEIPIYEEGTKIGVHKKAYFKIVRNKNDSYYNKHKDFIVSADAISGEVDIDYEIDKYVNSYTNINDLYKIFKASYANRLDFTELEDAVNNKIIDNYLRDRLLEFVSLKLLYSRQTTPERGYIRAKRFIDEFNKRLNLNLTSNEIDRVMNNYKENKFKTKILSF